VVLEEEEGLLPGAIAGLGDEDGAYDEVDEAFLATLSTKEKRLLLKRLKEQAAGVGGGEGEGGEGKSRKRRKREKDKKRSKKVCGLLDWYLGVKLLIGVAWSWRLTDLSRTSQNTGQEEEEEEEAQPQEQQQQRRWRRRRGQQQRPETHAAEAIGVHGLVLLLWIGVGGRGGFEKEVGDSDGMAHQDR
jgi:hypothetical protein